MESEEDPYYLELNPSPIRFEPVGKFTNVFFDEANKQVFAVRSGGATGVVVKGPDDKKTINFRMEDRGDVISIKLSRDQKILAIQRSPKSVEFVNFTDGMDSIEYSQSCKDKSTRIIGFNWVNEHDVIFITDNGVEYYQVINEKRTLKHIKAYSVAVNWFVWLPESACLLLSSGILGNVLHPFQFKQGTVAKLPKFEVDVPAIPKPPKLCLLERDVTLGKIYGKIYIIVLRHQAKSLGSIGAEIVLYQLQKDSPAKKTDVLQLDLSGRFAVNVVDSLVVVHHQASKTSMLYDIGLRGDSDGYISYHHPVLSPLPIKPFMLKIPVVPGAGVTGTVQDYQCELYSPHWIVFEPNIIIDAKLGCLWYIQVKLSPLMNMIPDKVQLIDFLLMRKESKMTILKVCKHLLSDDNKASLSVIASIFDKLNHVYWTYQEAEVKAAIDGGISPASQELLKTKTVIEQSDMYTHVFSIFNEAKASSSKFVVAILLEYIRSLNHYQIPVQHYLYELVINTLVHSSSFYQLHQFLQYHVLSDSKPLACLLLALESVYAPSHQLALDMLKRLSTANEEIVEVLLSKQQIFQALRFMRSVGAVDTISARKFLEASRQTDDLKTFYTVYKFFEQRNLKLRGNARFAPGEHCEQYTSYFVDTFGTGALEPQR